MAAATAGPPSSTTGASAPWRDLSKTWFDDGGSGMFYHLNHQIVFCD
jgi:hypothetical protein